MAASPPSFSPGRPPNERDWMQFTNGDPGLPLGWLVSSGTTAPVNNVTTATPFNTGEVGSGSGVYGTRNSLAGRVLLLQPTAAGVFLTSSSASMVVNVAPAVVALQSTLPPVAGRQPGVLLQANERVIVCMLPTNGWLQWLGNAGAANLIVWELV